MDDKKSEQILSRPPENCSAEHLRTLRKRAQAALASQRERMTKLEQQLTGTLEEISGVLAAEWATESAETKQSGQEAQRMRQELEAAKEAWQREQEEINAAMANRQQELDQQNAEFDERVAQLEARERELAEREQQLAATRQELDSQRQEFDAHKSAWIGEKTSLEADRSELQHKFDLALDDVRRLRGRAAELEQELSRRPEQQDDSDAAELIHLRAERDALVERVEELERQPAAQIDADSQHQLSDIQRRFELAVEDVRELKTLNAKLEARLAEADQRSVPKVDSGGTDWESMKRRMLDSLSEDADEDDPVSRKERSTIEGTIRITDDVVAKKDDEIARLREQLAAQQHAANDEEEDVVNELLDSDEIIQQHRKRLAQLEKEMEEKLRAAELELSVERAKIARKQVELNDWRAELESMQAANSKNDGSPSGAPKRRWLSKLGLGGEDE